MYLSTRERFAGYKYKVSRTEDLANTQHCSKFTGVKGRTRIDSFFRCSIRYSHCAMQPSEILYIYKRNRVYSFRVTFKYMIQFDKQLTYLEQYLKWDDLPKDKSSAQSLIETHKEMRNNMLEASMQCLTHGQNLLEILKKWKAAQAEGQKVRLLSHT